MKKIQFFALLSLFILTACSSSQSLDISNSNLTKNELNPHSLGTASSPVVEVFSDPQCPACGVIVPRMEKLIEDNPDLARLNYYHFPLSYHDYAFIAAEASECAGDQGKFFEYLNILYANQNSISDDYLNNVADGLNLDRKKFDTCLSEHKFKDKINAQMKKGSDLGLPGTPSFYINGTMVQWAGVEKFKAYLESLK